MAISRPLPSNTSTDVTTPSSVGFARSGVGDQVFTIAGAG
jgi:hypothetical protein